MRRPVVLATCALLVACGPVFERSQKAVSRDAIVGGTLDLGDEQVFQLKITGSPTGSGTCSATLIGARTLLTALRPGAGFVVFFGSIAGVFGNPGQVDYSAANDALDTLAATHAGAAERVLSIDWGPWASEAGMVSDSLGRLFEESGMGLIELADGTSRLLDELAGAGSHHQVVVVRCAPEMLGPDIEVADSDAGAAR